jgi:hypothetical protein
VTTSPAGFSQQRSVPVVCIPLTVTWVNFNLEFIHLGYKELLGFALLRRPLQHQSEVVLLLTFELSVLHEGTHPDLPEQLMPKQVRQEVHLLRQLVQQFLHDVLQFQNL